MMHYIYRVLLQVLCGFAVYILVHKNFSYATHTHRDNIRGRQKALKTNEQFPEGKK